MNTTNKEITMNHVLEIKPQPRTICTNGMVLPKTPSQILADKLLAKLNSKGEAHIKTDTVLRKWSACRENAPVMDCTEVVLHKQSDGKYSCFIGYTTESGRFIDCWGFLGGSESCISDYLKPRV